MSIHDSLTGLIQIYESSKAQGFAKDEIIKQLKSLLMELDEHLQQEEADRSAIRQNLEQEKDVTEAACQKFEQERDALLVERAVLEQKIWDLEENSVPEMSFEKLIRLPNPPVRKLFNPLDKVIEQMEREMFSDFLSKKSLRDLEGYDAILEGFEDKWHDPTLVPVLMPFLEDVESTLSMVERLLKKLNINYRLEGLFSGLKASYAPNSVQWVWLNLSTTTYDRESGSGKGVIAGIEVLFFLLQQPYAFSQAFGRGRFATSPYVEVYLWGDRGVRLWEEKGALVMESLRSRRFKTLTYRKVESGWEYSEE